MRIAVYHNLGSGGAKKALYHIVTGLRKRGHDIDVYTTSLADHAFYDLRPHVNSYHIEPVRPVPNGGFEPLTMLRRIRALKQAERRVADRIHAGGYDVAFVTNCHLFQHPQLLRYLSVPVVLYSQEMLRSYYDRALLDRLIAEYDPPKRRLLTPLGKVIANGLSRYRAALDTGAVSSVPEDRIFVNSMFSRDCFKKAYGISPSVCYLGADSVVESPANLPSRKNYALSIGGFEAHKGHDWVIRAIGRIDAPVRPALTIIGDRGSDRYLAVLRQLAKDQGVTLDIQRSISDDAVRNLYRTAKLTVCAQWAEPFGFAPIESQAQGTPVVAVREGGLMETVIDGVSGITCDRDVDQLAAAMTRLLTDTKLWQTLSHGGAKFVVEKFDWNRTVAQVESKLHDTIGRSAITTPKVAIVTLNWNGLSDTAELLTSLQAVTYPNFTTIVVDNGSDRDDAGELEQRFGGFIEVIRNPENYGFAKGNNIGISRALSQGADYVLLLNNDTVVKPDFLDRMVRTAQQHNVGIAGPKILYYGTDEISSTGGRINWHTRYITSHVTDDTADASTQDFLTGCCLLIRRDVFEKIGDIDGRFFLYYEDADFCLRTRAAGYSIVVDPSSAIWHKISRSVGHESAGYHYYTNRNKLLFCRKNAPFLVYAYHLAWSLITLGYSTLRMLRERDAVQRQRLTAVRNGIRDYLRGALGKRRP